MKKKNIRSHFFTVMATTITARALGILQDALLFRFFKGVSAESDAFIFAGNIARMIKTFFSESLLGASLPPLVAKMFKTNEQQRAQSLLTAFATGLIIIFSLLLFISWSHPKVTILIFAPGLSVAKQLFLSQYLPYMIFFLMMTSIAEILSIALRAINKFFLASFQNALFNIIFITAILFAPSTKILALTYPFIAMIIAVITFISFSFYGIRLSLPSSQTISDIKLVFQKILPLGIGLLISQGQLFSEGIIASFMQDGHISILHYTFRIFHLITTIFSVPISSVLIPQLSQMFLLSKLRANFVIFETIKTVTIVSIVIATQIAIKAELLFSIFYGDKINPVLLQTTVLSLNILLAGTCFLLLQSMVFAVFYANYDTKTPMKINAGMILFKAILYAILVKKFSILGIVFSSTVASILFSLLGLWVLLKRDYILIQGKTIISFFVKIITQNLIFLAMIVLCAKSFPQILYLGLPLQALFIMTTSKLLNIRYYFMEL